MANLSSCNSHVITADQLDFERIRWKQQEVGGFLWQVYTHIWYVGETSCSFSFICHNVSTMSILEYHSDYPKPVLRPAIRAESWCVMHINIICFVLTANNRQDTFRPAIRKNLKWYYWTPYTNNYRTCDSYRICPLRIWAPVKRIFSILRLLTLWSLTNLIDVVPHR